MPLGTEGTPLSHRFFKYQVIITKFQNLKTIWTKRSILAFPDILSLNVTLEETKNLRKLHQEIPQDISFYDEFGSKVQYAIEHNDDGHVATMIFSLSFAKRAKIKGYSILRMTEKNMQ